MTKMLIDRATVEQALEALEWHYRQGHSNTLGGFRLKIDEKALRNLKAALAEPTTEESSAVEPVQEPFALPCPTPKACKAHCCSGHCIPRSKA